MTPRRALRLVVSALLVVAAVAAIRLFSEGSTVERGGLTYADAELAGLLDSGHDVAGFRSLIDFHGDGGTCRVFIASEVSGVACRRDGGWHLRVSRSGVSLDDPAAISRTEAALRKSAAAMAAQ